MERLGTAFVAIACAIAIALWVYGIYCYVQMVRHRAPGTSAFQMAWPTDHLTERGHEYRRRALRTYAWFGLVAVVLFILTRILSTP